MLLVFIAKKFVNVSMKAKLHTIYIDILEYAQILVTDGKFMIFDIESHSTK